MIIPIQLDDDAIERAASTSQWARSRAWDPAAQSSLRNALAAAKTIFTDQDTYSDVTVKLMAQTEPSLTFVDTASSGPNVISVYVATTVTDADTRRPSRAVSDGSLLLPQGCL